MRWHWTMNHDTIHTYWNTLASAPTATAIQIGHELLQTHATPSINTFKQQQRSNNVCCWETIGFTSRLGPREPELLTKHWFYNVFGVLDARIVENDWFCNVFGIPATIFVEKHWFYNVSDLPATICWNSLVLMFLGGRKLKSSTFQSSCTHRRRERDSGNRQNCRIVILLFSFAIFEIRKLCFKNRVPT